jgi:hypothetical protein
MTLFNFGILFLSCVVDFRFGVRRVRKESIPAPGQSGKWSGNHEIPFLFYFCLKVDLFIFASDSHHEQRNTVCEQERGIELQRGTGSDLHQGCLKVKHIKIVSKSVLDSSMTLLPQIHKTKTHLFLPPRCYFKVLLRFF